MVLLRLTRDQRGEGGGDERAEVASHLPLHEKGPVAPASAPGLGTQEDSAELRIAGTRVTHIGRIGGDVRMGTIFSTRRF
jgi:hypothetical protein